MSCHGPVIPSPITTKPFISPSHFAFIKQSIRTSYFNTVLLTLSLQANKPCPTSTARDKARSRGLSVDTNKARKCPQTAVSVVPLPIVVQDIVDNDSFNGVPIIRAPIPRPVQPKVASTLLITTPPTRPSAPAPSAVQRPSLVYHRSTPVDVPTDNLQQHPNDNDSLMYNEIELTPMSVTTNSSTWSSGATTGSTGSAWSTTGTSSSSGSSSHSGSSGDSSSLQDGLITPEETDYTPVILCAKRRSGSSPTMEWSFEKRRKYDNGYSHNGFLMADNKF